MVSSDENIKYFQSDKMNITTENFEANLRASIKAVKDFEYLVAKELINIFLVATRIKYSLQFEAN